MPNVLPKHPQTSWNDITEYAHALETRADPQGLCNPSRACQAGKKVSSNMPGLLYPCHEWHVSQRAHHAAYWTTIEAEPALKTSIVLPSLALTIIATMARAEAFGSRIKT
ncbi:hypothetical protein AYO21_01243 [Fonsecaea monophora]|uniref:Uncharacterized protein n=1 Tax=Fonsecaea monophora TaxID=254056 RepID=A0A177FKB8_9EURO|nr:hypothetical protein AYO21_01243 [Fonsecaea monophora]OAG44753.1 hypothetical protein AYO21_01243 [Fonsecaea monophora]